MVVPIKPVVFPGMKMILDPQLFCYAFNTDFITSLVINKLEFFKKYISTINMKFIENNIEQFIRIFISRCCVKYSTEHIKEHKCLKGIKSIKDQCKERERQRNCEENEGYGEEEDRGACRYQSLESGDFICPQCERIYANEEQLAEHLMTHSPSQEMERTDTQPKTHANALSTVVQANIDKLRAADGYKCERCGANFPDETLLNWHTPRCKKKPDEPSE